MGQAVSSRFNEFVVKTSMSPWDLYVEPFRIAPRIYFVGNEWVGAYLIDTEEGLILIDTMVFETVFLMLENIRKLGFDPKNLKHIFLSHFHFDHTAGAAALKEYTGAKIWLDEVDAKVSDSPEAHAMLVDSKFGTTFKDMPYQVDQFYDHSKVMQFGKVIIQTICTPGHTAGTTSFIITMPDEQGKMITAAMHGGVGPLTMTNAELAKFGWAPKVRKQFITDIDKLKSIPVDICIPSHPAHGRLMERKGNDPMDYSPFVDLEMWPSFLDERRSFVVDLDQKESQV